MRFPLRLTARLALGAAARSTGSKRGPVSLLDLSRDSSKSDTRKLPNSPIVWISGSDSLDHPHVAQLANSIAAARRYVFLQTSAATLRRRIHEFRPSSRLYLAIRFDGTQAAHDLHAGRDGAFHHAIDAIRSAKLAGFLVCAHLIVHRGTDSAQLGQLYRVLGELNLDGFMISPASSSPQLLTRAAIARRDLLTRPWSRFSQILDSVLLPAVSATATIGSPSHVVRDTTISESVSNGCEEGAQA
jgi:hypothetical protein